MGSSRRPNESLLVKAGKALRAPSSRNWLGEDEELDVGGTASASKTG